jgi:hypothetical protein
MLIRDIIARMRHDGCGGRAGKVQQPTSAADRAGGRVTSVPDITRLPARIAQSGRRAREGGKPRRSKELE